MKRRDSGPNKTLQLAFVNVSDPRKVNDVQRQLVRSRATTASHRDPTRKPKTNASARQSRRSSVATVCTEQHSSAIDKSDYRHHEKPPSVLFGATDESQVAKRAASRNLKSDLELLYLDGGHIDPFSAFPVPTEPWYHWLLDYYMSVQLPPGIGVVQQTPEEGRAYIHWQIREAISEPCYFYMQLLNACTPLVVEGRVSQAIAMWLRGQLVASINEAISDSLRALSTPTLMAVVSIALHERLFGDRDVAINVHGRAFARMVKMRGGVACLDLPRIGFKLLQWTDSVLSEANAQRSNADLMSAWAPESIRLRYPGYTEPTREYQTFGQQNGLHGPAQVHGHSTYGAGERVGTWALG